MGSRWDRRTHTVRPQKHHAFDGPAGKLSNPNIHFCLTRGRALKGQFVLRPASTTRGTNKIRFMLTTTAVVVVCSFASQTLAQAAVPAPISTRWCGRSSRSATVL